MPLHQRKQKAVYWAFSDFGTDGEPNVSIPVELDVRWEHGLSQEINPNTTPVAVDATVWVDRSIAVHSVMYKGSLEDLPDTPDEIWEVVGYAEIPDVSGRRPERAVFVRKFADSLPTVVS